MKWLLAPLLILAAIDCGPKKYVSPLEGPFRVKAEIPFSVEVDQPFKVSLLFDGVLPTHPIIIRIQLDERVIAESGLELHGRFLSTTMVVPKEFYDERHGRYPMGNEPMRGGIEVLPQAQQSPLDEDFDTVRYQFEVIILALDYINGEWRPGKVLTSWDRPLELKCITCTY